MCLLKVCIFMLKRGSKRWVAVINLAKFKHLLTKYFQKVLTLGIFDSVMCVGRHEKKKIVIIIEF